MPNQAGEIVDFETQQPMYEVPPENLHHTQHGGEVALERLDKAIERAQQDSQRALEN